MERRGIGFCVRCTVPHRGPASAEDSEALLGMADLVTLTRLIEELNEQARRRLAPRLTVTSHLAQAQGQLRDPDLLDATRSVPVPSARTTRGARDALNWLLTGGPGPLTGRPSAPPVPAREIARELAAAESVIYGQPDDRSSCQGGPVGRRRYAAG